MINVLISVNNAYAVHAKVMILSLVKNTEEDVSIFLFNHSLNEKNKSKLNVFVQNVCHERLHIIDIDQSIFDSLPTTKLFSIEMYYRIVAQYFLPRNIDRILWLDSDIVVLNDISDFYHQDFDSKSIIACSDRAANDRQIQMIKQQLQLPDEHIYFNSGVLLLNLKKMRQTAMQDIVSEIQGIKSCLTFPDQDILNYLYSGDCKLDDWHLFNYQLGTDNSIPDSVFHMIHILHYTTDQKPWNFRYQKPTDRHYWYYRKQISKKSVFVIYRINSFLYTPISIAKKILRPLKQCIMSCQKQG